MHLDASGYVRMRSDTSGKFRKLLVEKTGFFAFLLFFEETCKNTVFLVKIFRNFPDVSERIRTHLDASERIRVHPSASEQVRASLKTWKNLRKRRKNSRKSRENSRKFRENVRDRLY